MQYLYEQSPELPSLEVTYKVLRENQSNIQLICRVNASELGIRRDERGNAFHDFTFRYKLYHTYSDPVAVDSGQLILRDIPKNAGSWIEDTIALKLNASRKYVADIVCKDLNSSRSNNQFIDIDGGAKFNAQDVKVYYGDELQFSPYLTQEDTVELIVNRNVSTLYARMYKREFQMASAPFAIIDPKPFEFKPDYLLLLNRQEDGSFKLPIQSNAFYQLALDTGKFEGPTIYHFGENFPFPRTVKDLVLPLRYITTNDEYRDLTKEGMSKKKVDAYWLKVGGSKERAKELIRAYYSRVEYANRFFSSYLEGWKTDRGMCYIIYGEPDIVYKSTSSETWIYGEEGVYSSLNLTFTRVTNPFTDNDFRLNRSTALKSSWYRAVEFWRQGRVITYK
mgnify:CR=1 FL=1